MPKPMSEEILGRLFGALDGDAENVRAAVRALKNVFADPELDEITPETLANYGLVRYGVRDYDFVVDLTQRIGEMFSFKDLEVVEIDYLGTKVPVVTPRTLVRMKRDTGRPQDQLDVARLRERFDLEDL